MNHQTPRQAREQHRSAPADRLLDAREVAEMLGFAPGTIVDWAEAGKLPYFKVGRALRFRQSEVEAWLEEQRRGPDLTLTRPEAMR